MASTHINSAHTVRDCNVCGRSSVEVRFHNRHGRCVDCFNEHRRNNPRPAKSDEERARRAAYAAEWRARGGWRKQLDADLRRLYGITVAEYEAMNEAQNGVCAICGEVNVAGRRLAVDHNHETGQVRGLLCCSCNRGIGFLRDHTDILESAVNYLKSNG